MLIIRSMCQREDSHAMRMICYHEDDAIIMRMMMSLHEDDDTIMRMMMLLREDDDTS
jgi:hypothetical protein